MQGNSLLESFEDVDLSVVPKETDLGFDTDKSFLKKDVKRLKALAEQYFTIQSREEKKTVHNEINNIVYGFIKKTISIKINKVDEEIDKATKLITMLNTGKQNTLAKQRLKEASIREQNKTLEIKIKERQELKDKAEIIHNKQVADENDYFLWHLFFNDVFEKGGFDIVIGNPPYLNFKMYSSAQRENLKKSFPAVFDGKADLYYYFFSCAVLLSKANGITTFITSRYWIEAEFAVKLRNYLVNTVKLLEIVDFKNVTVFDGLGIKTCITTFKKQTNDAYNFYYRDHPGKKIDAVKLQEFQSILIPKSNLVKSKWVLKDNLGSLLISKIENNTVPLSNIADCKQGIVTGLDKAFITVSNEFKGLPKKLRKSWIKVGDIHKYQILPVEKRELIYTNEVENINDYPGLKQRLQTFKQKLSGRREAANGKIRWFDLQWARDPKIFNSEKLICRFKATENTFCFDDQGYYSSADTTVVSIKKDNKEYSLKYLLALLNSKLLDYYFKSYGKLMDYRYEYYPGPVGCMRIKKAENQEHFVHLVDNIISSKIEGKSTKRLEKRIDTLVYKLYDLTYEEACIIEGSSDWITKKEYDNISLEHYAISQS